jgi:nitrous oxidase accessory protein NosD
MRGTTKALMGAAVMAACLASAGPAWASNTVCAKGCSFTTIQGAIEAASPGATITIGKGHYFENVVVNKPLTLSGAGKSTVIYPAVSNPICSGGSLCEGKASNIILVEASNVTLAKLSLEGNNPNITSGAVVGGADIDARNGIITNHLKGVPYTNLVVSHVTVSDVYLRGIYASTSKGTFNFNNDTVTNVQGNETSIAMFAFEGSGVMERNEVSAANDAISENWSMGTQFLNNTVTGSGSGVHTDNNGGAGGVADTISGNQISACKSNGYGIFVFAPYVSANVDENKIKGCAVGLAAFGSFVSGQGPTFANNKLSGAGASTTEPETFGAYLTTSILGFVPEGKDLTVTLTHNQIEHFGTGVLVTQTKPVKGEFEEKAGGQATVTASQNAIRRDGTGAYGEPGTVVNAQNNWWGCPQGPNTPKCTLAIGTVKYTPWLTSKP